MSNRPAAKAPVYGGMRRSEFETFFVQEKPKEPYHVESFEDCERMLCGKFISVDLSHSKIKTSWGNPRCFDCQLILEGEIK